MLSKKNPKKPTKMKLHTHTHNKQYNTPDLMIIEMQVFKLKTY